MDSSAMTLYDLSKQLAANEEPMDADRRDKAISDIAKDLDENFKDIYFMLLCRERNDYTVFRLNADHSVKNLSKDIDEVLYNRGNLVIADKQKDGAWEIWIRDYKTKENFAYYLFPYDTGIIEVN